jgi:hypothetical protein
MSFGFDCCCGDYGIALETHNTFFTSNTLLLNGKILATISALNPSFFFATNVNVDPSKIDINLPTGPIPGPNPFPSLTFPLSINSFGNQGLVNAFNSALNRSGQNVLQLVYSAGFADLFLEAYYIRYPSTIHPAINNSCDILNYVFTSNNVPSDLTKITFTINPVTHQVSIP